MSSDNVSSPGRLRGSSPARSQEATGSTPAAPAKAANALPVCLRRWVKSARTIDSNRGRSAGARSGPAKPKRDERGADAWHRAERPGRQAQNSGCACPERGHHRKRAVARRARLRGHPVGHFALQHEDGVVDRLLASNAQHLQQDRRRDVVRQIADDPDRAASGSGPGELAHGPRNIDREEIGILNVDRGGRARTQLCGETRIDFDPDNTRPGLGERPGQRAAARPDFEKAVVGRWCDGVDDLRDPGRLEEVLAEVALGASQPRRRASRSASISFRSRRSPPR